MEVGLLGLGIMGKAVATNLLRHGFKVIVWNRTLSKEADITGVTGVKMIPFGVGRRICPGLGMTTLHIHLMMTRMVQEFEWRAYPPEKKLDFNGKWEFTVVMKESPRVTIKPREIVNFAASGFYR